MKYSEMPNEHVLVRNIRVAFRLAEQVPKLNEALEKAEKRIAELEQRVMAAEFDKAELESKQ